MRRIFCLLISLLLLTTIVCHAQTLPLPPDIDAALVIDAPMLEDPTLESPAQRTEFDPRLKGLWLAALARPEVDLRLQAADTIGRAFTEGYTGLADTAPRLAQLLESETHPLVRLALAKALVRLDATSGGDHGTALWQANQTDGQDMILLTDPALARWRFTAAIPVWRERLTDAAQPLTIRRSAAAALGAIAQKGGDGEPDTSGLPDLIAVATNTAESPALRLAAAQALPIENTTAVLAAVQPLAAGTALDRLIAARLLWSETDDAAVARLTAMAGDTDTSVAATAMEHLADRAPANVLAIQPSPLDRPDASLRYHATRALAALTQPDVITPLAGRLDDTDPRTRRLARVALVRLGGNAAHRDAVISAAVAAMDRAGWRGLEQAALLLGKLDHEPIAPRLVTLLKHDRPETAVAAAVGLRWLAVSSTLPDMLAHATQLTQLKAESAPAADWKAAADQFVQIFQTFGVMDYRDAEALLRTFIPKSTTQAAAARGAAVWALGKFYADRTDPNLAKQFASRLSDIDPMNPETTEVRSAAAVALGRMKAASAQRTLEQFLREENASKEIGGACKWALEQITGQPLPPLDTLIDRPSDWFLRPATRE